MSKTLINYLFVYVCLQTYSAAGIVSKKGNCISIKCCTQYKTEPIISAIH